MTKTIEELKKEIFREDFGDKADIREYAYSDICSFIDHAYKLGKDDMNNIGMIAYQDGMLKGRDAERERIIGVIDARLDELSKDIKTLRDPEVEQCEILEEIKKSILSTPTQNSEKKESVTVEDIQYFVEKSIADLTDIMETSENFSVKTEVVAQLELLNSIKETFFGAPPAEKECEWEEVRSISYPDEVTKNYKTKCGKYYFCIPQNKICHCGKPIKVINKED